MCADDIPLERLPTVLIPTGKFWDGLEAMWGDLVHELPDIPDGATDFFVAHIKPSLSEALHITPVSLDCNPSVLRKHCIGMTMGSSVIHCNTAMHAQVPAYWLRCDNTWHACFLNRLEVQ